MHPAYVLLSVCSLHFTLSLDFIPGAQSAFYTDGVWKSGLKTLFSDSGKCCHIFCCACIITNAISKGLLERINVNFCMGLTLGINSLKGLGKNHLINGVGVTVGRDEFVDMEWPSVHATSKTDHIIVTEISIERDYSEACIKQTLY